ncbi:MAG: alpha-mannosidase [Xenococcaceae cyanobacterium MO_207.B15]|nr:alpha-mannosidase [Xenococcaceae cyanobacterium MO_207.B15]
MDDDCLRVIERLRKLTQVDVINCWYDVSLRNSGDNLSEELVLDECQLASVNEKGYITFPKGRHIKWLVQKITVPESIEQYPISDLSLRLLLTWWAEDAKIFIDGKLVQEGDLFDSSARVLVTDCARPGQEFTIAIRLVSPNHDIGALMRSRLVYERYNTNIEHTVPAPGFVADELTILYQYLTYFEPEKIPVLAHSLNSINWETVKDAEEFDKELNNIRQELLPLANNIKQRKFHLLGHAHLDMAWLWTTQETYQVAQRTFNSVLSLQQEYPQLTFCHTSPALYQWIEENHPNLFTSIQDAINQQTWEAIGGMWIEPEVNLVSGESLIRQLLYGQQYFKEKFGQTTRVAWLPDSFGFPWQLPQILKQCGIDYFVTGKLHWNDTTKFPHGAFWWESPDATQIFTLMSPPNVTGVMDTNPITMTNYAVEWESQTGLQDIFWLPGVGDHGGGPTRDMLEVATKWDNSPFFPQIEFTTATEYLDTISQRALAHHEIVKEENRYKEDSEDNTDNKTTRQPIQHIPGRQQDSEDNRYNKTTDITRQPIQQDNRYNTDSEDGDTLVFPDSQSFSQLWSQDNFPDKKYPSSFPVWKSELYLELHRGCYTTHGEQKRFNRYCEGLLYQGELFATVANIICRGRLLDALFSHCDNNIVKKAESQPWQLLIETAWKKVLFNQFHDILPGTSIPEVFTEANEQWQQAIEIGEHILQQSLAVIASCIDLPSPPVPDAKAIVIFNSLNWLRSQIVSVATEGKFCQVYDLEGNLVNSQHTQDKKLIFLAKDIPSVGYRVYWMKEDKRDKGHKGDKRDWVLENCYLRVEVNFSTGNLDSIYDKINQREILSEPGNQLQAFKDQGQYWDAWNIDPNYEQHPLAPAKLKSIKWLEQGSIRNSIRVIRIIGQSEFIQDYILEKKSPILKIATTVDWQETHVLVKASFPLTIESDYATYETACGAIKRTTKPQTEAEKAQWEVSALKWVDLTDNQQNYGVSLLNDCKYGYDVKPNQLRISLLRSSIWPNPQADKGKHQFTYGIYPHTQSWSKARTVHKSYEFNLPLPTINTQDNILSKVLVEKTLPPVGKFLDLSASNLILMTVKSQTIDEIILRCYECHGETAQLSLTGDLSLGIVHYTDCLETKAISNLNTCNQQNCSIKPWKITTLKLHLTNK